MVAGSACGTRATPGTELGAAMRATAGPAESFRPQPSQQTCPSSSNKLAIWERDIRSIVRPRGRARSTATGHLPWLS